MTRTVIRHTLSVLAALALVSAFAIGPALAQDMMKSSMEFSRHSVQPKGLATKKRAAPLGVAQDVMSLAGPVAGAKSTAKPKRLATQNTPVASKSSLGLTSVAFGNNGF